MTMRTIALESLTSDDLTKMHVAVEDVLIEYRDSGISMLGPANGFVVKYKDGSPSDAIRLGTRHGLRIALAALFGVEPTELPR